MKISTVIFDWAGTTVDFGSFAPVDAFMSAFKAFGLTPTADETRAPMGMAKRAHIAAMLRERRLAAQFHEVHGREQAEADIDAIYREFEPALFGSLEKYAEPLPGVLEVVKVLREKNIKIGSTTGYTRQMMDIVAPIAKACGYWPDCLVCPDETGGVGRPFPYMLWRNLEQLGAGGISEALKIGDTAADMREGKAAGCLCVGVIVGSSMLGLAEDEVKKLEAPARSGLFAATRQKYISAGADFVIDSISELPRLIEMLGGFEA